MPSRPEDSAIAFESGQALTSPGIIYQIDQKNSVGHNSLLRHLIVHFQSHEVFGSAFVAYIGSSVARGAGCRTAF